MNETSRIRKSLPILKSPRLAYSLLASGNNLGPFVSEAGSQVSLIGLELVRQLRMTLNLMILPLQFLEYWGYICVPPCSALETEPRASEMLGKHSIDRVTSIDQ